MKWVCRIGIVFYAAMVLYSIPWMILPWANEELVRDLTILVIVEAATIIGMLWFTHTVLLAEEPSDINVEVTTEPKNVRAFKEKRNV